MMRHEPDQRQWRATGPAAFTLTVEDDGCGLGDPLPRGQGLANMKRRLGDVGGSCEIESAPGTGTVVRLVVPLARNPGTAPVG